MRRSIDGKIAMLSFCAIAAAVSTIVFVITWMAIEHNNKAARDAKTMVVGGFTALEDRVKTFAIDYAWWQDAYDNIRSGNEEWIASNMGGAVTQNESMNLMAIADPAGTVRYAWVTGSGDESNAAAVPADLARQGHGALSRIAAGTNEATAFVAKIGNLHFAAATARIVPESGSDPDPKGSWSIILGLALNEERVAELGKNYLLDDLTFVTVPDTHHSTVLVAGNEGAPDAVYLAWTPLTPGFDLLRKGGLPISLALLVFSFLGLFMARKANSAVVGLARKEEESYTAARTDVLTGLPNRLRLHELIASRPVLKACKAGDFAALFIDMDGFKRVNDTVGHDGGDELIREVGARLSKCLPATAFVARVGGDEFNVVLKTHETAANVSAVARDIVDAFRKEFVIKGKRFNVGASVGYAVSHGGDIEPSELLRRADVAMYEAKSRRAGEPLAYVGEYEGDLKRSLKIGESLRKAMLANEVEVHYQPIISADTLEMTAVEALARWRSPELGTLSPLVFVPAAEDAGLISALDAYVFDRVCKDLSSWPGLKACVNVSPVQLRNPDYANAVAGVARDAGIEPSRIEFELTERILVTHPEIAGEILGDLRKAGFTIALDDFGTGYSSISYLQKTLFDRLKIDGSFVSRMEHDPGAASLVQNIAALARVFGMQVVAEGVETEEQMKLTRLAGCELQQGHFFSEPMRFSELVRRFGAKSETECLTA